MVIIKDKILTKFGNIIKLKTDSIVKTIEFMEPNANCVMNYILDKQKIGFLQDGIATVRNRKTCVNQN